MRINSLLMILATGSLMVLQSCTKNSQEEIVRTAPATSNEVIAATVAEGATYELILDEFADVTISKQAANFAESTAGVDSKSGLLMYKYVPATGFTGSDEVVLKRTQTVMTYAGNTVCTRPGESYDKLVHTYVTIKFKVTK